jgi:hypothetical protein
MPGSVASGAPVQTSVSRIISFRTQQKQKKKTKKKLSYTTRNFLLVHWFLALPTATSHSFTPSCRPHLLFFWWSNRHAELTSLIVSLESRGTSTNSEHTSPAGSKENRLHGTVSLTEHLTVQADIHLARCCLCDSCESEFKWTVIAIYLRTVKETWRRAIWWRRKSRTVHNAALI